MNTYCTRQQRSGPIRNSKKLPDLLLNEAGAADVEYSVGVDADLDLDLLGSSLCCGADFHYKKERVSFCGSVKGD